MYATMKGALRGFAKSLAREWAPDGITVNVVSPSRSHPRWRTPSPRIPTWRLASTAGSRWAGSAIPRRRRAGGGIPRQPRRGVRHGADARDRRRPLHEPLNDASSPIVNLPDVAGDRTPLRSDRRARPRRCRRASDGALAGTARARSTRGCARRRRGVPARSTIASAIVVGVILEVALFKADEHRGRVHRSPIGLDPAPQLGEALGLGDAMPSAVPRSRPWSAGCATNTDGERTHESVVAMEDDGLLGGEVPEEGPRRHPGPLGDLLRGRVVETVAREQLQRGVDERLAAAGRADRVEGSAGSGPSERWYRF